MGGKAGRALGPGMDALPADEMDARDESSCWRRREFSSCRREFSSCSLRCEVSVVSCQ